MPAPLIHALTLLYELQNERGIALLPHFQQTKKEWRSFDAQADLTHQALTLTQKICPDFWALLPERFFTGYAQRRNEQFRVEQTPEGLMEHYIYNLEHPIAQMATSLLSEDARFAPAQATALLHFIRSLSRLAELRDIGLLIYSKAEISPHDNSRIKNVATAYLALERLYLGLADENLKNTMEKNQSRAMHSIGQMDQLIRKIKSGMAKGLLATTPLPDWVENFNREITMQRDALLSTIENLIEQGDELASHNALGQTLDSDIDYQFPEIRALPLFRGLSEATLRNLLKGAHLSRYDKNYTFMTQGESMNRFFILLDGWAKTLKSTADGQESIVQILGKRESLLDTGFTGAALASVSARTITPCRVLSLSLSMLRDHVSRNRELAQNMLTATTVRLQRLVAQFEQITLKNAVQKVGWFLVNLHLETGLEGAPLELPFDKALIAAYLNIKPETLSRVLREMREKGFVIEKNKVILPTPDALCEFCDPDMALRCCRAERVNCAPIQTARRAEGR